MNYNIIVKELWRHKNMISIAFMNEECYYGKIMWWWSIMNHTD